MKSNITSPSAKEFNSFMNGGNSVHLNANGQLVSNATTLRHEEGKVYDDALIEISRLRLNGIEDLRKRGLIKPLGGLGTILSMYERVGEMTGAVIDMDGRTGSNNDRITFDEVGVPIPIFHKEWNLGERVVLASRQRGEPLDTTQMRMASRVVLEAMEDSLFNGIPGLIVSGLSIYGYTTHPSRNPYTLTADWTADPGTDIIPDVKAMLQLLLDAKKYGPYILYVAKDIMINLESDYSATKGTETIKDRILRFQDISEVKGADFLADGEVLLIQMDRETVDLAVAQDIRNLTWNIHPMQTEYMVLSAMAPRIKADRDGNCGIVHGS